MRSSPAMPKLAYLALTACWSKSLILLKNKFSTKIVDNSVGNAFIAEPKCRTAGLSSPNFLDRLKFSQYFKSLISNYNFLSFSMFDRIAK